MAEKQWKKLGKVAHCEISGFMAIGPGGFGPSAYAEPAEADRIIQAVNNFTALLGVCEAIEYWLSDLHPSKLPCCFPRKRLHAAVKAAKLPAKEQAK